MGHPPGLWGLCLHPSELLHLMNKSHLCLVGMRTLMIVVTFNQSVGRQVCHQHAILLLAYGFSLRLLSQSTPVIAKRLTICHCKAAYFF